MDQEKLARLPKWAQIEIGHMEQHIEDLKAQIIALNAAHPGTNVQVSDHIYGDYGLPDNAEIDFYVGDGSRRKYRDMITVQHLRTKGSKVLRVSAHGGRLIIQPSATNSIELTTDG